MFLYLTSYGILLQYLRQRSDLFSAKKTGTNLPVCSLDSLRYTFKGAAPFLAQFPSMDHLNLLLFSPLPHASLLLPRVFSRFSVVCGVGVISPVLYADRQLIRRMPVCLLTTW